MIEITFVFVLLGVMSLYFNLILGRICRWSKHWFVQKMAQAAYIFSILVNTVALGSMPKEHDTVVWILYLVALNNSLVVYDRKNEQQCALTLLNIGIFIWRSFGTVSHADLQGLTSIMAKSFIFALVSVSASCKIFVAHASASKRGSKEVDWYMRREHLYPSFYNASTLMGYRYLVDSSTTVEDIYRRNYDLEASAGGELQQRKDICLSFALFRLLFRRCHGLPCHEANLPKTRDLVLEGLLPQNADDEYTRGFGVVEVELAFLHDHIHGVHVLWSPEQRICYLALAVLKAVIMYIGSVLLYIRTRKEQNIHVRNSIALLLLHGFFDLLQIIFYYNSDRWMVSYMCRYHAANQTLRNGFQRLIASVNRYKLLGRNYYWQNRIGQYSLLELQGGRSEGTFAQLTSLPQAIFKTIFPRQTSLITHKARESAPVVFPADLKTRIAQVLRSSNGLLDGVLSLERDNYLPQGGNVGDKIKVILKWHIATCYCEIANRLEQLAGGSSYEVAMALSRYCAYLVAFRPELLPGLDSNTKLTFREVLDELTALLGERQLPTVIMFDLLEHRRQEKGRTVTLSDGLNLGWHLMNNITDNETRWAILDNIWVKLVLSIVPQEEEQPFYAERHTDCLAQGGELVTHLWAMLSHAGILKQQPWPMA